MWYLENLERSWGKLIMRKIFSHWSGERVDIDIASVCDCFSESHPPLLMNLVPRCQLLILSTHFTGERCQSGGATGCYRVIQWYVNYPALISWAVFRYCRAAASITKLVQHMVRSSRLETHHLLGMRSVTTVKMKQVLIFSLLLVIALGE